MKLVTFICFILPTLLFAQNQIGPTFYGENEGDLLGYELSISDDGTIIAVSAPSQTSPSDRPGMVKVYRREGNTWQQLGNDLLGFENRDWSGIGLALSNDGFTLAIGAYGYGADDRGRVDIYQYDNSTTTWKNMGDPIMGIAGEGLGTDLSLSEDGLILSMGGALANSTSGIAKVYQFSGTDWEQIGDDLLGESNNDYFGKSISMSNDGTILAVGAYNNDNQGNNSGYVDILKWNGNNWSALGNRIEGNAFDQLGFSLSLDSTGTEIAVSAPSSASNSDPGSVTVYELDGTTWIQKGSTLSGLIDTQNYGQDVSLSSDGNLMVVSESKNSETSTNAGKVFIYRFTDGDWMEIGVMHGESSNDLFGWSVAISEDGSTVMVGAIHDTGANNINDIGSVKVFNIDTLLNVNAKDVLAFSVWPNPTKSIINIQYNASNPHQKVEIFDAVGKLILNSTENQIDLGHLQKGLYFVKVSHVDSAQTQKIILN